jgi:hypothetical protein
MSEREILAHYHDRCASRPTVAPNFGTNCSYDRIKEILRCHARVGAVFCAFP